MRSIDVIVIKPEPSKTQSGRGSMVLPVSASDIVKLLDDAGFQLRDGRPTIDFQIGMADAG
jgi:hypothetical protein